MVRHWLIRRLPWLVIILLIGFGFFFLKPKETSIQVKRDLLIHRLEKIQRLEVMQVHLLAHETVQANRFLNQSEFLIVARGRAIYGIDLSQVQIHAHSNNSIELILPRVSVFELVLNPQDIEYLGLKKGLLTSQQRFEDYKQSALRSLHTELRHQANDNALLLQAEQSVQHYFEGLFEALDIKDAKIRFHHSLTPKIEPDSGAG